MDKQTKKASSSVPTPRAKDERKPVAGSEKETELNVHELEERIAPSGLPLSTDR
jgi:hypothetical protein